MIIPAIMSTLPIVLIVNYLLYHKLTNYKDDPNSMYLDRTEPMITTKR